MEVIEDGNIMDRIPILLQRDLEYYQQNQTVLSETVCRGVVGGRLDFPRNASFAAVKIVLWLEDEFSIAFHQGSGMFVKIESDDKNEGGPAKTSDPDKFVQLAIKSSDALLEHLHMLAQEALDHADLPVLTATLGAAALLKNSLHCYVQFLEDSGSSERHSLLLACYKRYVTMAEAVGERVLDLHNRVLSLYILQDSGGRPIDDQSTKVPESGSPSVQGWWLYMQGSRKDLWDTVPPRMAQRIFAGMLNETLTILNVRYCQANTTETTTPLLINDVLNILLCVAQLLPAICNTGADLTGLDVKQQTRDVRDVHAKCNELFKCMVYRGAMVHFIHQAFKETSDPPPPPLKDRPCPWFMFVSPNLFDRFDDVTICSTQDLPRKTALGLELLVLLAQPQPSWPLLVKVLMMRDCHLARMLLIHAIRHQSLDNSLWPASGLWYSVDGCAGRCKGFLCTADGYCKFQGDATEEYRCFCGSAHSYESHQSLDNSLWPASGLWYSVDGCAGRCKGFLCTADGYCKFQGDATAGEEYARVSGALTFVLATIGSKAELKSTLSYALEISGKDWAACLDKRQVWCDRRPPWLAGILGMVDTSLKFIPPILVNAVQTGASMYQTMSLCLSCISRSLDCIPRCFTNAAATVERCLPSHIHPVGGSVLLQLLLTLLYEELQLWAKRESNKEKIVLSESNGEPHMNVRMNRPKQVRIVSLGQTFTSSSASFDASYSSPSSIALAVAEALCFIDEDDKHTQELELIINASKKTFALSNRFGLEDFPEFAGFFEEGNVPGSNAERASDAAALTSQILITPPGRDSLRVIFDHLQMHAERIYKELGIQEVPDVVDTNVPLIKAPLLYIMFHIGRRPFDQHLRGEWPMPWSRLVGIARAWGGAAGARTHVMRRVDMRSLKTQSRCPDKMLSELCDVFKTCPQGVL